MGDAPSSAGYVTLLLLIIGEIFLFPGFYDSCACNNNLKLVLIEA
jgi:hypothetical protein